MVFRHLNMDFTIFLNIILNLSKLSLSFKTKTQLWGKKKCNQVKLTRTALSVLYNGKNLS